MGAAELRDTGLIIYKNLEGKEIHLMYKREEDKRGGSPFHLAVDSRMYRYKTFDSMMKRAQTFIEKYSMSRVGFS